MRKAELWRGAEVKERLNPRKDLARMQKSFGN
jgi:hypothetical protein